MKPLLLVNFKTYPEALGKKAILLAQQLAAVKTRKYQIAVAPSILSLEEVIEKTNLPVFAQHVDAVASGARTGSISVDELKQICATGSILNHSEHKLPFSVLRKTITLCKKNKLVTVVCASSLAEVKKIALLQPDYLAYEPQELIGGDISVTTAKPEIITEVVQIVKKLSPKTKVLCGAGIQSSADVRKALRLGTVGVLVSHIIVKAKNPKKVLEELCEV